jgi:Domain of unknown function (DUF1854)
MNPETLKLFYEPPGTLRLTVGEEKSYPKVSLYQSAPLSKPGEYLSFLDSKSEEIVLVRRLSELTSESRSVAEQELKRRYLTAKIQAITNVKQEFGVTYWHVATDRGPRDFVVQSLSESCAWLSDTHLLITDVDGCRFEIKDQSALDEPSQKFLGQVL